MIKFNPDGSLKLPDAFQKQKDEQEQRMKTQKCLKIYKDVVSDRTPKKCVLRITLSDRITDNRFLDNIYKNFSRRVETPMKIKQISEREIEVEIGSNFRRCSDCTSFIGQLREFLDGNMILDKGRCTYEVRYFYS